MNSTKKWTERKEKIVPIDSNMDKNHPIAEKDVKRRFAARLQMLAKSWKELAEPALLHRQKMLSLWASGFYIKGYARTHQVNLIDRGVSAVVPFLVEGNPKVMVETQIPNLRPWAYTTQLAMNLAIETDKLAENVFIPVARNSMFGAGITRTFFEYNRQVSYGEDPEPIKTGRPRVAVIDDSAYIGDSAAKSRQDMVIEGDIYRLPTDYAKELFHKDADLIQADAQLMEKYSAEELSKPDFNRNKLSLRDYSTFIDYYLYDENVTITIMPEGKKAKILNTIEEEGPDGSPYDYLGYRFFPDSTIPLPPAWVWHDQDVAINILADKFKESTENQKTLFFYTAAMEAVAKAIKAAPHLGMIKVDDMDAVRKEVLGGFDPENYKWFKELEAQHAKSGANPTVLGGKEATAPTLGQEQLLYANAARIVNNMSTRFTDFMISILRKYGWLFWTDPLAYYPVIREVPGVLELPTVFSQADVVGDFYQYIFKIIPYSTQRTSPDILYQKLMSFLTQWTLPTLALAAQQGSTIDFNVVNRDLAEYGGFKPSFNRWYKSAVPAEAPSIDYKMMPTTKRRGGKFGQQSDAFGATEPSRTANLEQQQARTKKEPATKGAV